MQENAAGQQLVIAAPLLPGKREAYVRFVQELLGQRREAYEASRQELGVMREEFWLLETAGQCVAVVVVTVQAAMPLEALSAALYALLDGRRPFDRWLRRHLRELHGLDLREEGHDLPWSPELIAEWTTSPSPNGRPETPAKHERRES